MVVTLKPLSWAMHDNSSCVTSSLPELVLSIFLILRHSSGCEMVPLCGFNLYFSDDSWCWALFRVLLGHLNVFSVKCLFKSVACLKKFVTFSCWFVGILYIFWIYANIFGYIWSDICIANIFSPVCGLPIHFLSGDFGWAEILMFMKYIEF